MFIKLGKESLMLFISCQRRHYITTKTVDTLYYSTSNCQMQKKYIINVKFSGSVYEYNHTVINSWKLKYTTYYFWMYDVFNLHVVLMAGHENNITSVLEGKSTSKSPPPPPPGLMIKTLNEHNGHNFYVGQCTDINHFHTTLMNIASPPGHLSPLQ